MSIKVENTQLDPRRLSFTCLCKSFLSRTVFSPQALEPCHQEPC